MTTHVLDVTWPIVDRHMPLADLRAEAIDLIRDRCRDEGWTMTSFPTVHVRHGAQPVLHATVNLRVPQEHAA